MSAAAGNLLVLPHRVQGVFSVPVRVWGMVEDRLIELRIEPGDGCGPTVVGLPHDRVRSTVDRVRAALVNAGIVQEAPGVVVRLDPPLEGGPTWELDLPIAVAWLAARGRVDPGIRWVMATGRLGLDGRVWSEDLEEPVPGVIWITALGGGNG